MANPQDPRDTSIPANPSADERTDTPHDTTRDAGISNRPIEDEQREQQNLPPRGRAREEDDRA